MTAKKFSTAHIKPLPGGRDPLKLVEEFIERHGKIPKDCLQGKDGDSCRWMLTVEEGEELEILLEQTKKPSETTIYMGLNVATVPLRGAIDVLVTALEIADGLVGIKLSLVGHFLVLSSTMTVAGLRPEDLEFHYQLITAQHGWFRAMLAEEFGGAE
jgi:hypothetical protein